MTTRRNFLATATLLAATMPLTSDLALATPAEAKPQLMFVQTAEDMKADDKTLRLVNVGKQTAVLLGSTGAHRRTHRHAGLSGGVDGGGG